MIVLDRIYEFRVADPIMGGRPTVLSTTNPAHTSKKYIRCKCVTILENHLVNYSNWYCHIIEDKLFNSPEQQAIMLYYLPFRVAANSTVWAGSVKVSLSSDYIGKLVLETADNFLWESDKEQIIPQTSKLSPPTGMTCNNPNCKEHFPWADSPNIGDKFLCYSCRTNPTTRIILGY